MFALSETHYRCLETKPQHPWAQLFLAHGAGAGWDHPWLNTMAELLAAEGIWVRRIEFPYAQWMREAGKRRPPQPVEQLQTYFSALIQQQQNQELPCFVGGKSMGGRVAAMVAGTEIATNLRGVVALGYPFHPVRKPENLRLGPLQESKPPVLVVQGTRDAFGTQAEVASYELGQLVELAWLEDGDHDFSPRKASGLTQAQLLEQAVAATVAFMRQQSGTD